MAQPPKSPPSKTLEGRDAGKPDRDDAADDAAEQQELARRGSRGRPPRATR